MWAKIVSIGFFIINLAQISEGATYIYKKNVDIYDKHNWENESPQAECDGLILQIWGKSVTTAKKLEVKQIVFGYDMSLFFNDDTEIVFDENSKSDMNCVKLNGTEMQVHFWVDGKNWITHGKEDNEAVPHIERLPGQYDDVILPKGILSGKIIFTDTVIIKSLKFGLEQWTSDDYLVCYSDPMLKEILGYSLYARLTMTNQLCLDESGCETGNSIAYRNYCQFVDPIETFDCVNPIEAIGFCNKFCGASIVFSPGISFKIKVIEEKLKNYDSDTHVSKVKNDDGDYVIQIIFTEKRFTGNSLEEARNLEKKLIEEKIIQSINSQLLLSGYYYKEGETTKTTLSLLFGTLSIVCLILGLLFVIFEKETKFTSVRERLGLGQGPLTYRSIFFSRNLSVSEGAGLILERQSVTGSIINLPKSFENPSFAVFKKKSSSTSESSESLVEDEAKENQEEKIEPELFEEQERKELIDNVAEDGELVDLTEMT